MKSKERKSSANFALNGIIFFLLFVLFWSFSSDYYVSADKIKPFKGTLHHYEFNDKWVFLAGWTHHYFIYINERQEPFQITVTFLDRFKKKEFERYINRNDTLELMYANAPLFFFKDRDILLSINSNRYEFLNARYSLDSLNDSASSAKYVSIGGIILCLLIKLSIKNAPNQALKLTE